MSATPHLALPLLAAAQAQKHVTHNEALLRLDAAVHLSVIGTATTPLASPVEGDRYLVTTPATGAFAGHDTHVALFTGGAWDFFVPQEGWRVWIAATHSLSIFTQSSWRPLLDAVSPEYLAINATATPPHRLVVRGESSLFNHAGAGHRLIVNKQQATDTASLLFQSDWSGRAEIGLNGQDKLSAKVSADGSNWVEALRLETNGRVALPLTTGVAQGIAPLDAAAKVPVAHLPALTGDAGSGGVAGIPAAPAAGDAAAARFLSAAGGWADVPTAGRNMLRNPSFLINQRNVSGTVTLAAGQFGHDGVKAGASGVTYTFAADGLETKLTITAGSVVLPVEANFTAGGRLIIAHDGTAQARLWQVSASGAYAAATRAGGGLVVTGVNRAQQINVEFNTGTLVRPQLEMSATVTPFERRSLLAEEQLCRRYTQIMRFASAGAFQFSAYNSAGSWPSLPVFLGVGMRVAPAATLAGTWSTWNAVSTGISGTGANLISFYFNIVALGNAGMSNPANGGFDLIAEL